MHKKFDFYLNMILLAQVKSATIQGHAKAPSVGRRVPDEGSGSQGPRFLSPDPEGQEGATPPAFQGSVRAGFRSLDQPLMPSGGGGQIREKMPSGAF